MDLKNFLDRHRAFVWGLIIIFLNVYYCARSPHPGLATPPPVIPTVTVCAIAVQDLAVASDYPGRVTGYQAIDIIPQVDGIVTERLYTEGQFVKQGTKLFKLNSDPAQAALKKAQANFNMVQQDFGRSQQLYDKKFLSTKDYQAARAKLDEAKSDLDTAQINLGYTTVTAPIDGYTAQALVSIGSLAKTNTTIMTRITQTNPVYIDYDLSEDESIRFMMDLKAQKIKLPHDDILTTQVKFDNGVVYDQVGRVDFKDHTINLKTSSMSARSVIANPDGLLVPGEFVRLIVNGVTYSNVIVIPDHAIMQNAQGPFVYIVTSDHKIAVRPVKLGQLQGDLRIIDGGLKPKDLVVIEGMIKVSPGQSVAVQRAATRSLSPQAGASLPRQA